MTQILTYPSFLKTREGGFVQTNDVLVDGGLRGRLTARDRRRFDRIAGGVSPERLQRLKARLAARAAAASRDAVDIADRHARA